MLCVYVFIFYYLIQILVIHVDFHFSEKVERYFM